MIFNNYLLHVMMVATINAKEYFYILIAEEKIKITSK